MEIRSLKNLLQKLFGIPSSQQDLIGIINSQVLLIYINCDISYIL